MRMMVVVVVMISALQCMQHGFFPLGNFSALALTSFSRSSPLLPARHF